MFRNILFSCFVILMSGHSFEYRHLEKQDIKEFKKAAASLNDAFSSKNYLGVSQFGTDILNKYSSILIQSDKKVAALREDYKRLDTLIGYSIYRIKMDSIKLSLIALKPDFMNREVYIKNLDNLNNAVQKVDVLKLFDSMWYDNTSKTLSQLLEENIDQYLEERQMRGQNSDTYRLLESLHFKSDKLTTKRQSIDNHAEEAFISSMASNNVERLTDFKQQYPKYRTSEVNGRLRSLEGDMVRVMVQKDDFNEMLAFVNTRPSSPFLEEVMPKLELALYRQIMASNSLELANIYLSRFSGETERGLHVSAVKRVHTAKGYGPDTTTQSSFYDYAAPNASMYKITDDEYKGQDVFNGPEYRLDSKGTIPDYAMKKMLELGIIEPVKKEDK